MSNLFVCTDMWDPLHLGPYAYCSVWFVTVLESSLMPTCLSWAISLPQPNFQGVSSAMLCTLLHPTTSRPINIWEVHMSVSCYILPEIFLLPRWSRQSENCVCENPPAAKWVLRLSRSWHVNFCGLTRKFHCWRDSLGHSLPRWWLWVGHKLPRRRQFEHLIPQMYCWVVNWPTSFPHLIGILIDNGLVTILRDLARNILLGSTIRFFELCSDQIWNRNILPV
jgi:hypothetical protein